MAQKTVERLLVMQHGNLHEVIPRLVQELGQVGASEKLGVTQNWVSRWLKANGYAMQIVYIRTNELRGANHV